MSTAKLPPRAQVLNDYCVDSNGRITSPGKFEGEPMFAPHFWDIGISGFSDSDDGTVFTFKFKNGDPEFTEWPELKAWLGRKRTLKMREDLQGFVHCF